MYSGWWGILDLRNCNVLGGWGRRGRGRERSHSAPRLRAVLLGVPPGAQGRARVWPSPGDAAQASCFLPLVLVLGRRPGGQSGVCASGACPLGHLVLGGLTSGSPLDALDKGRAK